MNFGGSWRIFQLWGINVYIHWAWILAVVYFAQQTSAEYHAAMFPYLEALALFGMVLMHEFGHALACRSVGGKAERIVLFPLGGIAFVSPPNRPGPMLWSLAAGPLVNVLLLPLLCGLVVVVGGHFGHPPDGGTGYVLSRQFDFIWFDTAPGDLQHLACGLVLMDVGLFVFNMLPIYPLDGGQIFRSLLWFFVGPAWSLWVASGIGLVLASAAGVWALFQGDMWLVLIAAFAVWQSIIGLRISQQMGPRPPAPPPDIPEYRPD